jgi:hypothetical protein
LKSQPSSPSKREKNSSYCSFVSIFVSMFQAK